MPSLLKRFKRSALYYFALVAVWIFNLLPRRLALICGHWLGLAAWRLIPRDRANIDRNLTRAFGDRYTPAERKEIGRKFFSNSGKNLIDVVRFRRHYANQIAPLVAVEGLDNFERAYRQGKGIIAFTGHIGNFELLAVHMTALGYPSAVIGRELYDVRLNSLLVNNRTSMGLVNIATSDSPKRILHWLKDGKVLGVLMDTDSMRVRNLFVPFFGHPAATPVSLNAIGLRIGASFLPVACVRTPDDRYKLIIGQPLAASVTGDEEADLYNVTLLCNKALEGIISQHPDQWIWLHNRWNAQPQNSA